MQQFTGINVMSYYMPTVLIQSVGLSNMIARLLTAINSTCQLIFGTIFIPFTERWGRRRMLMISALGMCFAFLVVTILLGLAAQPGYESESKKLGNASIAFFFVFYLFWPTGQLGIPWLYPAEINSLSMRTKGAAVATATNWLTNFIIVEITPIGIQNLKWRFYIIWIITNALILPIVYLFYPETCECSVVTVPCPSTSASFLLTDVLNPSSADRTLEDIDAYYRTNPSVFVHRDQIATSVLRPIDLLPHKGVFVDLPLSTKRLSDREDETAPKPHSEHLEASSQV